MGNGNGGLKKEMGVDDPAQAGSDQQSQEFKASFQKEITAISGHLTYTATNAEAARHDPLAARRDALYPSFQSALGQIDRTNPAKAQGAIGKVLGDASALNGEVTKFRQEAEKARNDWKEREPKLETAVQQVEELEKWEDAKAPALRGLVDGIRTQVNERKFAQACKVFDQFEPKLKPIYEEYLKQKEAKEKYDPALEALQPRLTKACAGEHVKLKPKQDEIGTAQNEMEASAKAKNYVQAYQQVCDLASKVEAYELAVEELEKQKKAYEEAWAALQDNLAKAEQSQFKKLEPKQQEITAAKPPIEASAQKEEYEEALKQVNELSTKVDEYLAAVEELEKQKKAYEDAWAALQPKFDQTSQSQFKKLAQLQDELTKIKGEIDAAVQAEDFEKALQMVNDLSGKVDTYLAAVEEAEQQRKAYEEAWGTVGPKFTEAMQSTSVKLAPQRDEMTALKEQIDKDVEAEDFESALTVTNGLGTKADAYLEAATALAEQKDKYEEALHALQPELDAVAKSSSPAIAPLNEEIARIRGEMDKAVQAEEYEQAFNHAEDLRSKVKTYQDELAKAREEYEKKLAPIDAGMKEVNDCGFSELEARKAEIATAYQAMTKLAEAEDYQGASAAAEKLAPQVNDFALQRSKALGKLQQKIHPRLEEIESGLKEFEKDKSPLLEQIKALINSIRTRSSQGDADYEKAAADMDQLSGLFDQLKNDPCLKAKRSADYKKAVDALEQAKADAKPLWTALEKAKMDYLKPLGGQGLDPNQGLEVKRLEEAVRAAELKKYNAAKDVNRILESNGCSERVEEVRLEPPKWP